MYSTHDRTGTMSLTLYITVHKKRILNEITEGVVEYTFYLGTWNPMNCSTKYVIVN